MKITTRATDLVHAFCQFTYNWTQEDITAMFERSHLGASYWKDRFQEANHNMVHLYMVADAEHKSLIVSYLVNKKYPTLFKKQSVPETQIKVSKKTRRSRRSGNASLRLVIDNTRPAQNSSKEEVPPVMAPSVSY